MGFKGAIGVMALSVLMACGGGRGDIAQTPDQSGPVATPMRWDHLPNGAAWTQTAFAALDDQGAALLTLVPQDIDTWCPAYTGGTTQMRRAFWTGMLSSLAKHESTWRQDAVGGNGRWFGLVQIAPATARGYGCTAGSGAELKNGHANINCAIRIWAHTVPRDGVVSAGFQGIAADWGPFHQASKRQDMRNWIRAQPYCALP